MKHFFAIFVLLLMVGFIGALLGFYTNIAYINKPVSPSSNYPKILRAWPRMRLEIADSLFQFGVEQHKLKVEADQIDSSWYYRGWNDAAWKIKTYGDNQ